MDFFIVVSEGAAVKVCYFEQEPDHQGKLRWVMPGKNYADRCSCTQIRRGGVNLGRHTQLDDDGGREFSDNPLFTQDQESIQQYFNCKGNLKH